MSPFTNRTLIGHLGRGAGAALLVVLAFHLLTRPGFLPGAAAIACSIGAIVLLRGCPMCWLIGLIETVSASSRKGQAP